MSERTKNPATARAEWADIGITLAGSMLKYCPKCFLFVNCWKLLRNASELMMVVHFLMSLNAGGILYITSLVNRLLILII